MTTAFESEYPKNTYSSGSVIGFQYTVHPTAIVDENAKIGRGTYIGPYCIIGGNVVIGEKNRFESHVVIGSPPEHRHHLKDYRGKVFIGDGNTFREFVTVNAGIEKTEIGNNNLFLKSSHVGHDCVLKNNITLSCGVKIGGHSLIQDGANLGLNAVCHQFSIIGAYAMIGMGAVVTKKNKIYPLKTYIGNPAKYLKENEIAMERNKITREQVNEFWEQYKQMTP